MFGIVFRHAPPASRRARFARWWRNYVGSIAFVALALIAALGFARVENARYEGCVGGNLLRQGLREAEKENIVRTRNTDLSTLFPGVPVAVLDQLAKESIERSRRLIAVNYSPRQCGTHIQLPLTNATVILPLGGG